MKPLATNKDVLVRATDTADERLVTVGDLARDLGITVRTLRFYEDKGLIAPRRVGSTRAYSHRDRARMILILRGKRLGFSLREIAEFLDLYDSDPQGVTQMRALVERIGLRRKTLEDRREAIEEALRGLADLEGVAVAILAEVDKTKANASDPPGRDGTRRKRAPSQGAAPARTDRSLA